MKHVIYSLVLLAVCSMALPADAKRKINYNMKQKVLYGDKTLDQDAFQNRGPASTRNKSKSSIPALLQETDSPRFLSGKDKTVDCKINNVGTSYRGEQCSTSFWNF